MSEKEAFRCPDCSQYMTEKIAKIVIPQAFPNRKHPPATLRYIYVCQCGGIFTLARGLVKVPAILVNDLEKIKSDAK